jgi:type VI secretion system protein ImpG
MRDDLLLYYERELSFLRQMGAEFAEKYPKIASRLVLEPDKCEDPHVERMLEGFALLAGRIHLKIDDDFPEVTQALLNVVYPHYLRPIPSMSIAEFVVDPTQTKPETGLRIARGAALLSRPVDGSPCRFRTCYDLAFWPIAVGGAQWRAADRLGYTARPIAAVGAFSIELHTEGGVPFSKLALDSLRFYINGESELAFSIYELVLNNCVQVVIRDSAQRSGPVVTLPASALRPVGFDPEESALPYTSRSFAGYQVIQEYFSFPQKFLFFEVTGLERAVAACASDRIEIHLLISPFERADRRQMLETGVSARTFRLGCTPIINLFPQTAEPILVDHSRPEYPVVPDATRRHSMEVFSVEEVLTTDPRTQEVVRYEPFYSLRHAGRTPAQRYWQAARRLSGRRNGPASEIFLSLIDRSGGFAAEAWSLTVRTICTNSDLPARLPFGNATGDFEVEGAVPVKRIIALVKPTITLRPPAATDSFWRLVSQLSLNYLSLVEDGGDALREMFRLYNFSASTHIEKQIEGIVSVRSRRHYAPLRESEAVQFARGTQVEIEFDENQFVGGGVYLFAAVIESFLGQYVSMNSFCQLLARTRQRKEALKSWPARAGRKVLL